MHSPERNFDTSHVSFLLSSNRQLSSAGNTLAQPPQVHRLGKRDAECGTVKRPLREIAIAQLEGMGERVKKIGVSSGDPGVEGAGAFGVDCDASVETQEVAGKAAKGARKGGGSRLFEYLKPWKVRRPRHPQCNVRR